MNCYEEPYIYNKNKNVNLSIFFLGGRGWKRKFLIFLRNPLDSINPFKVRQTPSNFLMKGYLNTTMNSTVTDMSDSKETTILL